MSVSECIVKLVNTGKITSQIGDEAQALYERSKGEFTRSMGPAEAEAAAALATARSIEAGARALKNDAAKQAIAFANFERTALEHRDGLIAGVMDQLSASLRGRGTRNVDSVREDIWARTSAMFGDAMEKYSPGVLGTSKAQIASAKNIVRELFGVASQDNTAASAAKAFTEATDYGAARVQAAGKRFEPNENWRLPQPWQSEQVRKVRQSPEEARLGQAPAEWKADFRAAMESGGIARLWDRDTGKPATADRTDFILDRAYRDITSSGGSVGTFAREQRTFEFASGEAGAEAWLKLQQKYGVGDNVFGMLTGHMQRMAAEIALSEVVGPNHGAVIAALMPRMRGVEAQLTTAQRLNPARMLESSRMVERTYDVLTGRANAVEGPLLAGIMGGLRSLNTAAQLKMATISSIPGDSVTSALAGNFNGIPATRIVAAVTREIARGGADSKALAARLQLVAHTAQDYGHGYRFFQDQVAGPMQLRWLATTAIRAGGLQAWTEMMKRTFSMEFLGHLSDMTAHSLDELRVINKPTADFLERYGVSAADWERVRAVPHMEVEGARFLDTAAIPDQALAERIRTGVIQERRFAVLEPDARIRAIMTGGLPQGTFMGEVARSLALFKSFSMTMAATHIMRIFTQDTWGAMAKLGLPYVIMGAAAGAAAIQAKNILNGKDLQSMADPKFWAQSMLQGNGIGIYGDILQSAFTRTGRSPTAELLGPVAGVAEDLSRLTSGEIRKLYEGKATTFGAELTRVGRRYTVGTWFTKLAVDRLLWDNIQQMIDPDYRGSFRRSEDRLRQETGQHFWWRPGETTPGRGPSFNEALEKPRVH